MRSSPFARSRAIFAAISAALASGSVMQTALMASGAETYKSRGKGRPSATVGRSIPPARKTSGKHYPFSSTRQDKRAANQVNRIVNGFSLMQTLPARARA